MRMVRKVYKLKEIAENLIVKKPSTLAIKQPKPKVPEKTLDSSKKHSKDGKTPNTASSISHKEKGPAQQRNKRQEVKTPNDFSINKPNAVEVSRKDTSKEDKELNIKQSLLTLEPCLLYTSPSPRDS